MNSQFFLADGGEPYRIFDGVVIDADASVLHEDLKLGPEVEGVGDGQAHGALRQMGAAFFQAAQGFGNALKDREALAGAGGLAVQRQL